MRGNHGAGTGLGWRHASLFSGVYMLEAMCILGGGALRLSSGRASASPAEFYREGRVLYVWAYIGLRLKAYMGACMLPYL